MKKKKENKKARKEKFKKSSTKEIPIFLSQNKNCDIKSEENNNEKFIKTQKKMKRISN